MGHLHVSLTFALFLLTMALTPASTKLAITELGEPRNPTYLLPVASIGPEEIISINKIQCPKPSSSSKSSLGTNIRIQIMTNGLSTHDVQMWECRKIRYDTICSRNLVGMPSEIHRTTLVPSTVQECELSVTTFISRGHNNLIHQHPDSECGYMHEIIVTSYYIRVTLVHLPYSPIWRAVIGNMFHQGKCTQPICQSLDQLLTYKTVSEYPCPIMTAVTGVWDASTGDFSSDTGHAFTINTKTCWTVCGKQGYSSVEGHFVIVAGLECSNPTVPSTVKELNLDFVQEQHVWDVGQLNTYHNCLVVLRVAIKIKSLEQPDMQFFYPLVEGNSYLYKIQDGKIKRRMFMMKSITLSDARMHRCAISFAFFKDCSKGGNWGGLVFNSEELFIPGMYLDMAEKVKNGLIHEPPDVIESDNPLEDYVGKEPDTIRVNPGFAVAFHFSIVYGAFGFLLIFLPLCFGFYRLIRRRSSNRPTPHTAVEVQVLNRPAVSSSTHVPVGNELMVYVPPRDQSEQGNPQYNGVFIR